ncbi:hypothetical protein N7532_008765 [Penicillium argentinense]|uniref:Transcription factor domain-containing protein n=1 Tax=Penicillium argentinense TaxID=1131581 RepID=A0A9W9EY82_9EURO|nr:uncharacterized protein N7532_008765 [Penicillium argentinense]KAJ5090081.1 hypothetical protein N7532_008765 [Penicillium argentinense]
MALSDIKATLSSRSPNNTQLQLEGDLLTSKNSLSPTIPTPETSPSSAERTARDAPMSLIQEIKENMSLPTQTSPLRVASQDVIANGIVSEDVAFSKLSSRWLFMSTDPIDLRSKSSLLFGTCILAGIHITPALYGSETHQKLYKHVYDMLAQSQLVSGTSLDTIQALLIFSMWDLRPTRDHDHGNSWLLSGLAAMKVMMITRFENLFQASDGQEVSRSRELLRTWNLICLCHLQFSIGSGRPPVISRQYFEECAKILNYESYNARDELVVAGVELYRTLWELISSNEIRTDSVAWPEIERLRRRHEHIYHLDSSEPLRFAYSCTYLILTRRTLRHINESHAVEKGRSRPLNGETQKQEFIQFAVGHSHQVLNLFLSMSDLTTYIHPAYENLLCSFAMVTLAELADHVTNIFETTTLMEQAVSHIQRGGKAEPVSRWSLSIMKQHILGGNDEEAVISEDSDPIYGMNVAAGDILRSWEDVNWSIEQEFPSLEEVFFGGVL